MAVAEYLTDLATALRAASRAYFAFSENDFFQPGTNILPELAEEREAQASEVDQLRDSPEVGATWTLGEAHVELGLGKAPAWGPTSVRWRVHQSERRLGLMARKGAEFRLSGRARRTIAEIRASTENARARLKHELVPSYEWRADQDRLARTGVGHQERGREYRVWFATDRVPLDSTGTVTDYSDERDDEVHFGACDVFIPDDRAVGTIGSPWWRRLCVGQDDRLKLKRLAELDEDAFWRGVRTQLHLADTGHQHAVVFIHGYNTSFREAVVRAAQLGVDLNISGAMAIFSWPSVGRMRWYIADEATIEASAIAITQFLVDFAQRADAEAVHLIAHSMGNRALLRAVDTIASDAADRSGKPFNQIILAAPDVDAALFGHLATAYRDVCDRTTLYAASRDRAVGVSAWIHRFPRAGLLPPITIVEGVDTVDASRAGLAGVGHSYFCEAGRVLNDIHSLITSGAEPAARFGMRRVLSPSGELYWQLR